MYIQSDIIRIKETKKQIANDIIKITVVGPSKVGKTHIINNICEFNNPITTHDIVQITFSPPFLVNNHKFQLGFIELSPEDFFLKLATELTAESRIMLLIFDFSSNNLKNECRKWCDIIQQEEISTCKKIVLFNNVN